MITCEARLKQWGNSVGVILPKSKLREEGLEANKMVKIMISPAKELTAGDIFGKMPGLGGMAQKDLDEMDKELDDLE
jgi:hypothetical protein